MAEEKPKEYKIMMNATNGYHLVDDGALHLSKEQATAKFWELINGGENPNDIKIVWQDDPRYPTTEAKPGFIPPVN